MSSGEQSRGPRGKRQGSDLASWMEAFSNNYNWRKGDPLPVVSEGWMTTRQGGQIRGVASARPLESCAL